MKKTSLCAMLCMLATNAFGATEISIYNQNLALIKKSQIMDLKMGVNEIVFDEVAEQFRPESAFIYGDGIRVLEQNYDYAGINYISLLNAHVGQEVNTVRQNPQNGENIFEKALLIAVDGASPVLKFKYGIETNFNGRVLFNKIPNNLNSSPVLMAKVETKTEGAKNLNLAYLASGLSWKANYVAKVNDKQTLALLARAAVSNNSGSSYEDVTVKLIAGDVNQVQNAVMPRMMRASGVNLMMAKADGFAENSAVMDMPTALDSYYVYALPNKTTLKDGQMKQVSFLNAPKVKYTKEGVINSLLYFGDEKNGFKDVHPLVYYHMNNNKDDGLGVAMPEGKVSFYAMDKNNALQFIGENMIDNKAEGQKISLQLGKFFDVYGKAEISAVDKISEKQLPQTGRKCVLNVNQYHYNFNFEVVNKSDDDVNMVIKQPLANGAEILKESLKGQMGEGNIYEWRFVLKAKSEQVIEGEAKATIEQCR